MRSFIPLPQQPTARIQRLRASIERATAGWGEYPPLLDLGIVEIDVLLGGGLACGALHEIAAARETEIPAATGFALALTTRATRASLRVKAILWIAEDTCSWENGAPYGPGLDSAGISPERLITVKARRVRDVLWAMEEALRCRAVCTVIGEVRAQAIDQVATRRLSLAAAAGNTLGLLLRSTPAEEPSAFATRWIIGAEPSLSPLPAAERWPGLGPQRLTVRLLRNRRGHVGAWILEWNSVEQRFELATYSEPLAQPAVDRPHRAAVA
jgi:protein ImuA